jgi:EmrB/QacA subfamily drug resistance transporter
LQPESKKWPIFLVVATGVFMSTLDSSMVNIALPSIMKEYGSPLRSTEWVVMIYLLTITSTLLFWGHLSDRFGRNKLYVGGLAVFGAGSLACSCAGSLGGLVLFRLFQALGAAMMMSTGPAIIKDIFPTGQLGRGLGLIGVAVSLGLMCGPSLGGVLLEHFTGRTLCLVTVRVGLLFALIAARILPAQKEKTAGGRIDWPGSLTWAAALTCMALAITHASSPEWSRLKFVAASVVSILLLFFFVKLEGLTPHPVLPLKLFRRRFFAMAVLSASLSFVVLFAAIFLIPFYLDHVKGMSGSSIGFVMMAIPLSLTVVAPAAGWLSERIGAKFLSTGGLLLSAGSLYMLAGLTPESTSSAIAVRLAMLGCGQAMFLSPNSSSVLSRVMREQAGTAAALLATARNFGMLMGVAQAAFFFSLFFGRLTNGLDMRDFSPASVHAFMQAMHSTFLITSVLGVFGAVLSWVRERQALR